MTAFPTVYEFVGRCSGDACSLFDGFIMWCDLVNFVKFRDNQQPKGDRGKVKGINNAIFIPVDLLLQRSFTATP